MNSVSHSLFLYEEAIKVINNNIIPNMFFLLMSIVYVYFYVNIIINNF